MNIAQRTHVNVAKREVTFIRTFDAPQERVFRAFAEADAVKQWWMSESCRIVYCTIDFRPGGVWHYCLIDPDGQEHWAKAIYREIVEPERIVYVDGSSDAAGNEVAGLPPGLTTVTLDEVMGMTKLTAHIRYATDADLASVVARGMLEGFRYSLDLLERSLADA